MVLPALKSRKLQRKSVLEVNEEDKATATPKNHQDAQAAAQTTSMNYCAADLIPFSGIASNDSPLPDTMFSNAAGTVFHTNIPIESFPPRPDTVYSEFESAAIARTLNEMHTSEDDDLDFIDEDLMIIEEPSPAAKKKGTRPAAKKKGTRKRPTKKSKRTIKRGQLKEDWATAGAFREVFNGEYKTLKFGNDPNKQAKLYNKSSPPQRITHSTCNHK